MNFLNCHLNDHSLMHLLRLRLAIKINLTHVLLIKKNVMGMGGVGVVKKRQEFK